MKSNEGKVEDTPYPLCARRASTMKMKWWSLEARSGEDMGHPP